ncbi:MAG TPA: hypothetical protein VH251_07955 [Verrucomicrobiae bacterium]|jgi:hypothetical protein|nr:hypothetical protein [Verrucomicrobiae bacterium]
MKTPRDILLERHGSAECRLDGIRRAVVGELNNKDAKAQSWAADFVEFCFRCLSTPWHELILPSRRIWTGMAMVWVLILVVNVSQRDNVSSVTGRPVRSSPVMMSWQAQQRLMNEVLADRVMPPDVDRPRNVAPKPRTANDGMAVV